MVVLVGWVAVGLVEEVVTEVEVDSVVAVAVDWVQPSGWRVVCN